jgi:hypothetical protein
MLFQLDQVYIRQGRDLGAMCSSPLPPRDQDRAMREASNLKLRALPEWVRIPPEKVRRLVESIGYLTHILQSISSDNRHLRSSERGVFRIDKNIYRSARFAEYRKIMDEAIYAGYLVEASETRDGFAFRVHRSLAPYFQISYRGPYYVVELALSDLEKMTDVASGQSAQELGSVIALRFDEQQVDLPLFEL